MSIKKYTSGSWVTVPYRKYETATDTITTFPADVIADGQSASANIIGNMSQTGTPSPQNIIMPDECGDLVTTGEHSGQYQLPISSGGTTTTVYLGQVESERKIKKVVFDGTEGGWGVVVSSGHNVAYITLPQIGIDSSSSNVAVYSSHYRGLFGNDDNIVRIIGNGIYIRFYDSNNAVDITTWKAYLAQQYTNGTPVTVWYILATPTTGVVNEPIRKIDTYADSVSVTGIPTTGTAEQFDVDTTLKPSEVDLTYHGWHEHSDTKYT